MKAPAITATVSHTSRGSPMIKAITAQIDCQIVLPIVVQSDLAASLRWPMPGNDLVYPVELRARGIHNFSSLVQ